MSALLGWDVERAWTLDDLYSAGCWSDDGQRCEIVDGVRVVTPPPEPSHEHVLLHLGHALIPAAPQGVHVIGAWRVASGMSYRVTDMTVLTSDAYRVGASSEDSTGVLLAVEIESPGSRTTDRVTKPAQYAAAGVQNYWRVETDPLRLHAYRLDGATFADVGSWGAGDIARLSEPFVVEIDIAALLPQ